MTADELRKLHEAATAAPWGCGYGGFSGGMIHAVLGDGSTEQIVRVPDRNDDMVANTEFIVALRNAYAEGLLVWKEADNA